MASGEKTLIELAQDFDVHPNQIKQWRDQLLEGATGVFGDSLKAEPEPVIDVKTLHAKIGELTLENDAPQGVRGMGATVPAPMSGALGPRRSVAERKNDDRSHREAERQPPGNRAWDQPGQRLPPSAPGPGWRSEADAPDRQASHGVPVRRQPDAAGSARPGGVQGRAAARRHADEHVATQMKRMGIEAPYRKPNTSKPAPGHKIYPYLLRKLPVTRPNQVWAMDLTYIPMARGVRHGLEPVAAHASLYLAAVVDCSRPCEATSSDCTEAPDDRGIGRQVSRCDCCRPMPRMHVIVRANRPAL
jgi:transposase